MDDKKIRRLVLNLGITPDLKGYEYTVIAIQKMIEKKGDIKVCEIYAEVAETLNINKPRVERAIRHAITTILNKPYGFEHLETIFGCKILRDNLTIGQFLNLCVETLKHFV